MYEFIFYFLCLELFLLLLILQPIKFIRTKTIKCISYIPNSIIYFIFTILTLLSGGEFIHIYKRESRIISTINNITYDKEFASKFRAERNFYLVNFTYFLFISIIRMSKLINN